MTHPTIASLTNTQPAQPVQGSFECYFDGQHLYIVHLSPRGADGARDVRQVYPPVAAVQGKQ